MCGIVGLHGPQDPAWIEAMNDLIVHRGPDDSSIYRAEQGRLSLAMRRLAIIDLKGGRQPMTTPDGRYTIVFNGEIYNAPELRSKLAAESVRFETDHSDTEVVLQLYSFYGEEMLNRLNGMFAFAIFDRDSRTLFCARDRFGIKPLYYFQDNGRFAFASELKCLLALPFIDRTLDRQSLFHYMSLMFIPGEATIFRGIRRLAPGRALTYRLETRDLRVRRWWRLRFGKERVRDRREAAERVRTALGAAVGRWALSDVPVGCSLSGGLDSSSIVSLLAQSGREVKTYTVGFTGAGERAWNELPLARLVADKWGTEHHEIVLDAESLIDDLPRMVWHLDEPYGGGLPSWAVFKCMSQDVKVGLTGTGGDEIFGDYKRWSRLEGRLFWWLCPNRRGERDFRTRYFDRHYYLTDSEKRSQVFQDSSDIPVDTWKELYDYYRAERDPTVRDRITRTDMETQLAEEFLLMTDRFSMAHSLEARTPFLDHEFVETVLTMQAALRAQRGEYKRLLRDAVKDLLPPELFEARKRGFVVPLKLWLRGRLRPVAERLLGRERMTQQGLFRPDFYDRYVQPHLDGRADFTAVVWGALMFQLWHVIFIEAKQLGSPTYDLWDMAA